MELRASFVHAHGAAVKQGSIQRRNGALSFRCSRHFHEGDAAGFARIPVLNHRNGLDGPVSCKKFAQLLLGHRDIEVPDINVSHEFIFSGLSGSLAIRNERWN